MASSITISILGDPTKFNRASKQVIRQSTHMGRAFRGVGQIAAGVFGGALLTRGLDSLVSGFKASVTEAEQSIKVNKLTAAALKSTGGIAGVTAGHITRLADKLSLLTGIDDEAIQGNENLLLTFTNVRNAVGKGNDIFDQATKAIQDMSVALGQDASSSSIQLGKALNDPIKGITALRRVGVAFTADQTKMIKTLVEAGDTLGAQKIILAELGKEFGGAAEAAATPFDKLKVKIGNLEEAFGKRLIPLLNRAATFLTDKVAPAVELVAGAIGKFVHGDVAGAGVDLGKLFGLEEDSKAVDRIISALAKVRSAIEKVVDFISRNRKVLLQVAAGVGVLAAAFVALNLVLAINPIVLVIGALAALGVALVNAYNNVVGFREAVDAFAKFVSEQFASMVAFVKDNLDDFQEAISHVVNVISALWGEFGDEIVSVIRGAFGTIAAFVKGVMKVVQGIIEVFVGIINGDWSKAWQGIKDIFAGVWGAIVGLLTGFLITVKALFTAALGAVAAIVGDRLNAVVGFFLALPGRIVGAISNFAGLLIGKGIELIAGLITGLLRAEIGIIRFFTGLPFAILGVLGNAGKWLFDVGGNIVQGLIDGIKAAWHKVEEVIGGLASHLPGPVKKVLGIGSPSRVFRQIGRHTIDGLTLGLRERLPHVARAMSDLKDQMKVDAGMMPNLSAHRALASTATARRVQPTADQSTTSPRAGLHVENLYAFDMNDAIRLLRRENTRRELLYG